MEVGRVEDFVVSSQKVPVAVHQLVVGDRLEVVVAVVVMVGLGDPQVVEVVVVMCELCAKVFQFRRLVIHISATFVGRSSMFMTAYIHLFNIHAAHLNPKCSSRLMRRLT